MGEVEVKVGCPHRLREPITWRTRYPCPACAEAGFPGLWAIALTVDYRPRIKMPRLSEVATDPPRLPKPPEVNPEVMKRIKAAIDAWSEAGEQMAAAMRPAFEALAKAGRGIEMSPLRIEVGPLDVEMNSYALRMRTDLRLSMAVAERVAMQQPPRIRIVD